MSILQSIYQYLRYILQLQYDASQTNYIGVVTLRLFSCEMRTVGVSQDQKNTVNYFFYKWCNTIHNLFDKVDTVLQVLVDQTF